MILMNKKQLLLTSVFGPFGVKDKYAEGVGMQMELLNNQITREQGVHSPRQSYWSFALYLLSENISIPTTVLDFPTWNDFKDELNKGYTHIGISFIVPNVEKVSRMTSYIRKEYPHIKIILGGYGTIIQNLKDIVQYDALCKGEGVRWLREYFGENPNAPIKHPALIGPAFEYVYGYRTKPKGSILMTGLGCNNGCTFCITTHQFKKQYIPLLETGKDILTACNHAKSLLGSSGFTILDENFLKQPLRARQLLEEMTKNKKPYVFDIFSSAEVIKELGVDFLVRLGIRMIWIGVESKKCFHSKTKGINIKELIQDLQSSGIIVNASAILFLDHHDKQTIAEEIDWVISLGSNLVQFMNYTPFPTTSLYDSLQKEGRLKPVYYRFQNGTGELCFNHPHINNPEDHRLYLKNAFKQKYLTDGPGIANMAKTAIQGYEKAVKDFEYRQKNGLTWHSETLRYVKSNIPEPDEFMTLRIKKMQKIALNLRPVLLAAKIFAPNAHTKENVQQIIDHYDRVLGKPNIKTKMASFVLATTAFKEYSQYKIAQLFGHESIIYQPPVNRVENSYSEKLAKLNQSTKQFLFIGKPISMIPKLAYQHVGRPTSQL